MLGQTSEYGHWNVGSLTFDNCSLLGTSMKCRSVALQIREFKKLLGFRSHISTPTLGRNNTNTFITTQDCNSHPMPIRLSLQTLGLQKPLCYAHISILICSMRHYDDHNVHHAIDSFLYCPLFDPLENIVIVSPTVIKSKVIWKLHAMHTSRTWFGQCVIMMIASNGRLIHFRTAYCQTQWKI